MRDLAAYLDAAFRRRAATLPEKIVALLIRILVTALPLDFAGMTAFVSSVWSGQGQFCLFWTVLLAVTRSMSFGVGSVCFVVSFPTSWSRSRDCVACLLWFWMVTCFGAAVCSLWFEKPEVHEWILKSRKGLDDVFFW